MQTPQYAAEEYPASDDTWTVGARPIEPSAVSGDHQTLELSTRVTRATLDTWRQYDVAGDVEVVVESDGEFRALDRSDDATLAVQVVPPNSWRPAPWDRFDAIVSDYSEEQVAPDGYEIELELTRTGARDRTMADPGGSGPWEFSFSLGTIGLEGSQVVVTEHEASAAGGPWTLPLLLEPEQARLVMESLSHVEATTERDIPDAANAVVDTTSGNRNTVSITTPSGSNLLDASAPTAVVEAWEIEWYAFGRWRIELELVVT